MKWGFVKTFRRKNLMRKFLKGKRVNDPGLQLRVLKPIERKRNHIFVNYTLDYFWRLQPPAVKFRINRHGGKFICSTVSYTIM